jgi:S-adenosylmethionine hydrolase
MKKRAPLLAATALLHGAIAWSADPLVLQSDFGVKDAAVASMKGVAVNVSSDLEIYDLTHEVPTFNIWEASLRLAEVAEYWPKGTVFVSAKRHGFRLRRRPWRRHEA